MRALGDDGVEVAPLPGWRSKDGLQQPGKAAARGMHWGMAALPGQLVCHPCSKERKKT